MYARVCGAVLLMLSADMGILYYLKKEELFYDAVRRPLFLVCFCILVFIPIVILVIVDRA